MMRRFKQKKILVPKVSSIKRRSLENSDDSIEKTTLPDYNDDLEFLNRFKPDVIAKLQPAFKNAGRQTVKKEKKAQEIGMWQPSMGTYRPVHEATVAN